MKIKDPDIINKIINDQEMSGLLNEAVEGLHRLIENKKFSYTIGTAEVKNKWIRKSDSFMAFCMDYIKEDGEGRIKKTDLRSKFAEYHKKHKIRGAGDKAIRIILQDNFGAGEGQSNFGGMYGEHCWTGIKWKDNPQEPEEKTPTIKEEETPKEEQQSTL